MIISTTDIPGSHQIVGCYVGVYSDGLHAGRDFVARVKAFFGGPIGIYDQKIKEVTQKAIHNLVVSAQQDQCDAVIGLRHEIVVIPVKNDAVLQVTVLATGIKLEEQTRKTSSSKDIIDASERSQSRLSMMSTPIEKLVRSDTSE